MKKRKRFQSASSRRESAGRTESLSERMGKERVWTARAFQFLGNRRPISARAKSTPVRRRSAASTPRGDHPSSRSTAETDVARDRAILPFPPPPSSLSFSVASFCTRAESRSLARLLPTPRSFVLSTPPGRNGGFVYAQLAKNRQR